MKTSKILVLLFCGLIGSGFTSIGYSADKVKFETDPAQRLDVRFRLFRTHNMWTFLELDTQTGQLWQVYFSTSKDTTSRRILINYGLADDGKNGRFTLYPTDNIWTFLLVDQDKGNVWQAQFSLDASGRGVMPILEEQ